MKKILKTMGIVLAVLFLAAGIYIGYMMIAYYRLPDKLTLEVKKSGSAGDFTQEFQVKQGEEYLIMTYNIGFGAYTEDFSFFMDGGKSSWAEDKDSVLASVSAMADLITEADPDFIFLLPVAQLLIESEGLLVGGAHLQKEAGQPVRPPIAVEGIQQGGRAIRRALCCWGSPRLPPGTRTGTG